MDAFGALLGGAAHLLQHHITPELREKTQAFGIPVMEYDGIAEVWVDSLADWVEIVSDPEFQKEVQGEASSLQHRS